LRVRLVVVTDIRGIIARNENDPVNWSSAEDKRFSNKLLPNLVLSSWDVGPMRVSEEICLAG